MLIARLLYKLSILIKPVVILLLLICIDLSESFNFRLTPTTTTTTTTSTNNIFTSTRHNNPHYLTCYQRHQNQRNTQYNNHNNVINNNPTTTSLSSISSISNMLEPILKNKSNELSFTLFSMLSLSSMGLSIESRYKIGKALSAPLVTMALGLFCSNIGLVPFSSTIYTIVNKYLVALAIPLLLFDSDLRKVIKNTGSLLIAFFIGTMSTIIGTIIASYILPLRTNIDGYKIACALASRHIGGAINFVAVAETLQISGDNISAAIAADNVVVALYFTLLFALSKPGKAAATTSTEKEISSSNDHIKENNSNNNEIISSEELVLNNNKSTNNMITLSSISISLAISSGLVILSNIITQILFPNTKVSSLPILSLITVSLATIYPTFFSNLSTTGTSIGILFMQMFFAVSGASSSIKLVIQNAPSLFVYSFLQIALHFTILVSVGKLCKLNVNELFLASNANVGGPTTAAAMAKAKDWDSLILPALLIGILGYAIGTPIGLALVPILKRLPSLMIK